MYARLRRFAEPVQYGIRPRYRASQDVFDRASSVRLGVRALDVFDEALGFETTAGSGGHGTELRRRPMRRDDADRA
jgi:hypothetical protein